MSEESDLSVLDDFLKSQLSGLGFQAGEPVYAFYPDFTLHELQEAHYGSTYEKQHLIQIKIDDKGIDFLVFVEMARSIRVKVEELPHNTGFITVYKTPDWYVEGWVVQAGYDPGAVSVQVRLYLRTDTGGEIDVGYVQRIREVSDLVDDIQIIDLSS